MFHDDDKSSGQPFTSYTQHLRGQKKKELRQIQQRSGQPCTSEPRWTPHEASQGCTTPSDNPHSQSELRAESPAQKPPTWVKIDDKAVIVNGKLVYLEEDRLQFEDVDKLVDLLRGNEIRVKDYIYGDRREILNQISKNHEQKKADEVEKYVNKNLKQEERVEADCSAWYMAAKENLFNST